MKQKIGDPNQETKCDGLSVFIKRYRSSDLIRIQFIKNSPKTIW